MQRPRPQQPRPSSRSTVRSSGRSTGRSSGRSPKSRWFFVLGLLAIAILYSAYNLYILDPEVFDSMSRGVRHVFQFGTVILAYGIGLFAFRRFSPDWVMQLWHLLYGLGLGILILLGLYDAIFSTLSMPLRKVISTFHEFLISPIPYVIIGIMNSALKRATPPVPAVPPSSSVPPGPPASPLALLPLALAFALLPGAANAQHQHEIVPFDTSTLKVSYKEIVPAPGMTADQLYKNARSFVEHGYPKRSRALLESKTQHFKQTSIDDDNKMVYAKGEIIYYYYSAGYLYSYNTSITHYVLAIQCRDNSYRYRFTDFVNSDGDIDGDGSGGLARPIWNDLQRQLDQEIKWISAALQQEMQPAATP
jgi:hypothetical protein